MFKKNNWKVQCLILDKIIKITINNIIDYYSGLVVPANLLAAIELLQLQLLKLIHQMQTQKLDGYTYPR